MSPQLINRSPDLARLRDEGYDIHVLGTHLLIRRIPYVNAKKEIKYGTLVSTLNMVGEVTLKPETHVVHFAGEMPCNRDGTPYKKIINESREQTLDKDIVIQHSFSSKPADGYKDYHEKMTTYARILSAPAISIDSGVNATPFPPVSTETEDSVFCYRDTASSRAGIAAVTRKLELGKIGIVGLGGTGSYVLDLVAKTPVKEIHLFDGDTFSQHNAFRAPGAASIDELRQRPKKVAYLKARYSMMHRHIIEHDVFIDESTASLLDGMDFVFLCLDKAKPKREIVARLEAVRVPFIDVGMGVDLVNGSLLGVVRATTSTPMARGHVHKRDRIPFSDDGDNNAYSKNIQIADLNALNAALAVIKWKKLLGFYHDLERELFSTYTIDGNKLINEDQDEASDGVAA